MKRFLKMLGAFALCMGLLVSPVQAEKFVVGFQPYDTISYQAIINAELGLWKKYTPEDGNRVSSRCAGDGRRQQHAG